MRRVWKSPIKRRGSDFRGDDEKPRLTAHPALHLATASTTRSQVVVRTFSKIECLNGDRAREVWRLAGVQALACLEKEHAKARTPDSHSAAQDEVCFGNYFWQRVQTGVESADFFITLNDGLRHEYGIPP